jgi:hypothetical protein
MNRLTKSYIAAVVAAGAAVMASTYSQWGLPHSAGWLLYVALAAAAAPVKLRLPGMNGTYSLSFPFILFGICHFTLAETLGAACLAAIVQSVVNAKSKPTPVQTAFNVANIALSVGACFLLTKAIPVAPEGRFQPVALALAAACYFVVNTVLVSGILALLQKKRLAEVCEQWYVWSFPYYLLGAALVGLTLTSGESLRDGAWVILLPLAYLVHFFVGLAELRPSSSGAAETGSRLPFKAKAYVVTILLAGLGLLSVAAWTWESADPARLVAYLALAVAASTLKVRLPRITGTLSINFVLLLAAVAELSFSENVVAGALAGAMQCLWRPKRKPMPLQVLFNSSCLALSTGLAWTVTHRVAETPALGAGLMGLLALSTTILYFSNTLMVSAVLSLSQAEASSGVWKNCCFWSFPYYLAGAAAAGVMVMTARTAGWPLSMLVLPLMGLLFVSYRIHVTQAGGRQEAPARA